MGVLDKLGEGLWNSFLMAYQTWWALVLGFAISAIVQAWIPREAIERRLAGEGFRAGAWATGLGAASSSCSYAAAAIARSLFAKGASARSLLAFQFASTNLVWELGLVLFLLLGWRFVAAELVGGVLLVVLMWFLTRLFVSQRREVEARKHAESAAGGHEHETGTAEGGWWKRLTSRTSWQAVADNFATDWRMLWKEITGGFLLAGFIGLVPTDFLETVFLRDHSQALRIAENVLLGPLVAIASFVCSVGNIPLAAVLWSGGISFAGVIAFIFADLVIVPLVLAYRKYYGWPFAWRITALMLVTLVAAALLVELLFVTTGLVPETRPAPADVFGDVGLDYKLALNAIGVPLFALLIGIHLRGRHGSHH